MQGRKNIYAAFVLVSLAAAAASQTAAPDLDKAVALYSGGSFSEAFALLGDASARADEKIKGDIADRLIMMGLSEYFKKNYKNAYDAFRVAVKLSPANYTGTQYYVRIRREMDVKALSNAAVQGEAPIEEAQPSAARVDAESQAKGTEQAPPESSATSQPATSVSPEAEPTILPRLESLLLRIEAEQKKQRAKDQSRADDGQGAQMLSLLGEIVQRQKESQTSASDSASRQEVDALLVKLDERLGMANNEPLPPTVFVIGVGALLCVIAALLVALLARQRAAGKQPERTIYLPSVPRAIPEIESAGPALIGGFHGRIGEVRGRVDAAALSRVVEGLRLALRGRDRSAITAKLSREIAKTLGLSPEERESVFLAALAHDAGYLMLDPTELRRVLDEREIRAEDFAYIKSHAALGIEYFKGADLPDALRDALLYHHERMDGSGYPMGLSGESIPLVARIIGAAETFVALLGERSYRRRHSISEAADIVRMGEGVEFDPSVVRSLIGFVGRVAQERIPA